MTLESDPHVAPEQPVPDSAQLTPLFCESFCSVAMKFCVPMPACTLAERGAIATLIGDGGAVIVMVAGADLVLSAADVAVSMTVAGEGKVAGAV